MTPERREYIACPYVDDPDAFAARIHGDTMNPKFIQGDIVIFSPNSEVQNWRRLLRAL
jgi:phage repressor protein C with HTH and peptisase S24 domain